MTVKKLVELLQDMPLDAVVRVESAPCNEMEEVRAHHSEGDSFVVVQLRPVGVSSIDEWYQG